MTELFRRSAKLVVGTLEVSALRFQFDVTRTLKVEPNTAEIKVTNLNEDHRKTLEDSGSIPVQLIAGYEGGTSQIFLGNLRRAYSEFDGTEIVTTITSGDGEKAKQSRTCNKSFPARTPVATVITEVAKTLGIGMGNLQTAAATARMKGTGQTQIPTGLNISGNSARELTALLSSCGYEWSIQDGVFQVLTLNQALVGSAVLLSAETGLVGSPTIDNKGVMSCSSLLIPQIVPGRILVLKSRFLSGQFRIETVSYRGDSHGNDWLCEVQGKKY